jgi:hypothetical protein
MTAINLNESSVRELNEKLQSGSSGDQFSVNNTVGKHALSVGLTSEINVEINGHVGYYCAGMNQQTNIVINLQRNLKLSGWYEIHTQKGLTLIVSKNVHFDT